MSDKFKLDGHGACPACSKDSVQGEHVKCYTCKGLFHAICSGAANDEKVATKTTITQILLSSTKKNIIFYCDRCLTNLEIREAESNGERLEFLEDKITGIDKQLDEIKKLLMAKGNPNNSKGGVEDKANTLPRDSLWADKERLATVRAPEPMARLVITKDNDEDKNFEAHRTIEKVLIEHEIPLAESHQNREGDLVLTCVSKAARDNLKQLVQTANNDIIMNTPNTKQMSITIVGLTNEYSKEEVMKSIVVQNETIKQFTANNKIEDHIKIHVVKPLRNKPTVYQVFASVSPVLRDGLRHHRDRILIGVASCKIYDRQQVMRCNNCQHFGHFAKECPTPEEAHCGKCSGNHRTDGCTSEERKCVNCIRKGEAVFDHPTFFHGCPTMVKQQELKTLNSQNRRALLPT